METDSQSVNNNKFATKLYQLCTDCIAGKDSGQMCKNCIGFSTCDGKKFYIHKDLVAKNWHRSKEALFKQNEGCVELKEINSRDLELLICCKLAYNSNLIEDLELDEIPFIQKNKNFFSSLWQAGIYGEGEVYEHPDNKIIRITKFDTLIAMAQKASFWADRDAIKVLAGLFEKMISCSGFDLGVLCSMPDIPEEFISMICSWAVVRSREIFLDKPYKVSVALNDWFATRQKDPQKREKLITKTRCLNIGSTNTVHVEFAKIDNIAGLGLFIDKWWICEINLWGNCIDSISDQDLNSAVLFWINLGRNKLSLLKNPFRQCTGIKYIYLDLNQIKELTTNSFNGLQFLERLSLKSNGMIKIEKKAISNCPSLTEINLEDNPINKVEVDAIYGCGELEIKLDAQAQKAFKKNSLVKLIIKNSK